MGQKSEKDTHETRNGILRALAPVSFPETEGRHRTDSTLSSKQVSLGLNRDDEPWIRTLKYSESPTRSPRSPARNKGGKSPRL